MNRETKPEVPAVHSGRGIGKSGDGLATYPEIFGFGNMEQSKQNFLDWIKGKKILDVGSGLNNFYHDLYSRYISKYKKEEQPFLVSMEPFLADDSFKEDSKKSAIFRLKYFEGFDDDKAEEVFDSLPKYQTIAARWPNEFDTTKNLKDKTNKGIYLPFQDKSFDIIMSAYSFPYWAQDSITIPYIFEEFSRILKDGGEIRFSPIMTDKTVINTYLWNSAGKGEEKTIDTMSMETFLSLSQQAGFEHTFTGTSQKNATCVILKKIKNEI